MEVIENKEPIAEVKNLFKQKSKWDVVVKGQTIRLKIEPCHCGVHAQWVVDIPADSMLPKELRMIFGDQNKGKTIEKILEEFHWHPTWKDRVMFRTMEGELIKWIKHWHDHFSNLTVLETEADELRSWVEEL